MKKILILTDYFAPKNEIASIRFTKIAKYLKQLGHKVSVMTDDVGCEVKDNLLKIDSEGLDVIRLGRETFFGTFMTFFIGRLLPIFRRETKAKCVAEEKQDAQTQTPPSLLKRIWRWIYFRSERAVDFAYARKIVKTAKKLDYDILISTYGDFAPSAAALSLKKKKPEKKWIADFRDPVYSSIWPKRAESFRRSYFRKIATQADVVTAVSNGIFEIHKNDMTKECIIITNGFDRDDLKSVVPFAFDKSKINFVYTGTLCQGRQNFTPFFRSLQELSEKNLLDSQKISVHYAGRDFETLRRQAAPFGLEKNLVDYGFIPREKSIAMQLGADVLLLASWNYANFTGMTTGKFLEYMMIGKPIISVIMGDEPNSGIKDMMRQANLGFCYEQARDETDYEGLKTYLLNLRENCANFSPNREYIEKFNYKNIAKEFEKLFN